MIFADGGLALENVLLYFEVVDAAGGIFDGRRDCVLAEREPRAGGVEHADRLVGQLASGKIAVRETHG